MRQVLLALTTIIAVASLAAVGTYAGFVDTETSAGNYIQAGSLELQLGDTLPYPDGGAYYTPDEDFGEDPMGDSVTATWNYQPLWPQGMVPGNFLISRVKMQNWGTVDGTGLDINCVNENWSPYPWPDDEEKDCWMVIESLEYVHSTEYVNMLHPSTPAKWRIEDKDGDGRVTLNDWELDPVHGLEPPPLDDIAYLRMTVVFHANAPFVGLGGWGTQGPKSYAGSWTNMTLLFALMQ